MITTFIGILGLVSISTTIVIFVSQLAGELWHRSAAPRLAETGHRLQEFLAERRRQALMRTLGEPQLGSLLWANPRRRLTTHAARCDRCSASFVRREAPL